MGCLCSLYLVAIFQALEQSLFQIEKRTKKNLKIKNKIELTDAIFPCEKKPGVTLTGLSHTSPSLCF